MRVSPTPLLLAAALAASLSGCRGKDETANTPPGAPPGAPSGPSARTAPAGGTAAEPDRGVKQVSDDVVLTGKVKNALMVSKVDTGKLNVDTVNGVVTLKGSVPTASQKATAEKVAKQVEGVSSVKNSLSVGAKK
jgi:hyperosmotically inducible periplasmic protein